MTKQCPSSTFKRNIFLTQILANGPISYSPILEWAKFDIFIYFNILLKLYLFEIDHKYSLKC